MRLKTKLAGQVYQFHDLKEVLGKANEEKSGDILAGIAAGSALERIAAKEVLSNILLSDIYNAPVAPYETDDVTRLNIDGLNLAAYQRIKNWSVAELREWLLAYETAEEDIKWVCRGLTAEMVAAVAKIMSNLDLVYAGNKIRVTAHCNTTIGCRGTLSTRLQPNHPTDHIDGIIASALEGLSYAVGDALIGLNPVNDTVESVGRVMNALSELKEKYRIPTQISVLGHITTQISAIQAGAVSDTIFQSISGSQKGNEAFGVTTELIREAEALMRRVGHGRGPNVMYFETGQGSALSSDANYGADQVTMEARCYGYARNFSPFMVNTVVGFIGPEYLYDSRQVIRAGLEDHFMGKLTGVPMGCDCCYTNHMMADQNDIEVLTVLLAGAGCNYVIGIPASDDVMLNYQTNSYHDANTVREVLGLRPIREFEAWCEEFGILENGRLTKRAGDPTIFLGRGV